MDVWLCTSNVKNREIDLLPTNNSKISQIFVRGQPLSAVEFWLKAFSLGSVPQSPSCGCCLLFSKAVGQYPHRRGAFDWPFPCVLPNEGCFGVGSCSHRYFLFQKSNIVNTNKFSESSTNSHTFFKQIHVIPSTYFSINCRTTESLLCNIHLSVPLLMVFGHAICVVENLTLLPL